MSNCNTGSLLSMMARSRNSTRSRALIVICVNPVVSLFSMRKLSARTSFLRSQPAPERALRLPLYELAVRFSCLTDALLMFLRSSAGSFPIILNVQHHNVLQPLQSNLSAYQGLHGMHQASFLYLANDLHQMSSKRQHE